VKKESEDSSLTPVPDRVGLNEEMLLASADGKYPPEQIRAAAELLDANEGKFPPGRRRIPPSLVTLVQRERLIQSMLKAASELGYSDVTMKDVLDGGRSTSRLFYIHFPSKEECFLAALDVTAARIRARAEQAALEAGGAWRDRLRAVLRQGLQFAVDETDAARALIVEARSAQCAIPLHDRLVAECAGRIHAWVGEDLGEGPDVDAAVGVVGALEAMLYAKLQAGDTDQLVSYLPKLMYFAVLVYEGHVNALREIERPATRE
jgi:AcrR family transcriptional regulator